MSSTLISVVEFDDNTLSYMRLHIGTVEDCEKVMDMLPAVSYSGNKTPARAYMKIVDTAALEAMEAHDASKV